MAIKITDILFMVCSVGVGIITLLNKEYYPVGISLIVAGFLIIYFSAYTSQIDKNELEIKKLKEKLIIYERLSKLEAEVYKNG